MRGGDSDYKDLTRFLLKAEFLAKFGPCRPHKDGRQGGG